jgi:hypothetical protein
MSKVSCRAAFHPVVGQVIEEDLVRRHVRERRVLLATHQAVFDNRYCTIMNQKAVFWTQEPYDPVAYAGLDRCIFTCRRDFKNNVCSQLQQMIRRHQTEMIACRLRFSQRISQRSYLLPLTPKSVLGSHHRNIRFNRFPSTPKVVYK